MQTKIEHNCVVVCSFKVRRAKHHGKTLEPISRVHGPGATAEWRVLYLANPRKQRDHRRSVAEEKTINTPLRGIALEIEFRFIFSSLCSTNAHKQFSRSIKLWQLSSVVLARPEPNYISDPSNNCKSTNRFPVVIHILWFLENLEST